MKYKKEIEALSKPLADLIKAMVREEVASQLKGKSGASGGNPLWSGLYEGKIVDIEPFKGETENQYILGFAVSGKSFEYQISETDFREKLITKDGQVKPEIKARLGSYFDFGITPENIKGLVYAVRIKKAGSNADAVEMISDFNPLRVPKEGDFQQEED